MNFCMLILPGVVAVLGTGVATINTASPTLHRRLANNVFTTKADLQTAVQAYDANATAAVEEYGPIADWNVSAITDMRELFSNCWNFNADISNWDTSLVTSMKYMFKDATAFNQPLIGVLGGAPRRRQTAAPADDDAAPGPHNPNPNPDSL